MTASNLSGIVSLLRRVVIISDFQDGNWEAGHMPTVSSFRDDWLANVRGAPPSAIGSEQHVAVEGGYIERLPLALLSGNLVDCAEIWTHWRGVNPPGDWTSGSPHLTRRAFRMNGPEAPFDSNDMLGHIQAFGPPAVLCVWGLGVGDRILSACSDSYKIYNSIDAPALRVPPEISAQFDLVLTGADWQSDAVRTRHPEMRTSVMPIGPEFASPETFRPLGCPKVYDVIYVAAAQTYKRHDILFNALTKLPRSLKTLCVCGYGDLTESLKTHVNDVGIDVDFIDPPGVPISEVNRLMNQSRMGVVCGVDDGAPAILTEYMLAGIPVLANSQLSCGLQYITPQTGSVVHAENFHEGITDVLGRLDDFNPREIVLANWTWPHSLRKLKAIIDEGRSHQFRYGMKRNDDTHLSISRGAQ